MGGQLFALHHYWHAHPFGCPATVRGDGFSKMEIAHDDPGYSTAEG